jgi:hypothetical protein
LLHREDEGTAFHEFWVNVDDSVSIWKEAMEEAISVGEVRRIAGGD